MLQRNRDINSLLEHSHPLFIHQGISTRNNFIVVAFLIAWTLLNLLQATFTGLGNDEALYWTWIHHPAWGYFDHPPLVMVVIKAGWILFHNELGVRLFTVLFSTLSLYGMYRLTKSRDALLFFCVVAAMPLVHVAGFFIAPDIPLVALSVVFFWLVKRYVYDNKVWLAVAIGVCVALMLYAKYHAILPVLLTVAAFPAFFKRRSFYIALITAVVLCIPHLIWQIQNHFPTIDYHINHRGKVLLTFENPLNFLVGQWIAIGLLTAPIVIWAAWKFSATNPFERILKFNAFGIPIFFFIFSLREHIEGNWTAVAFLPMAALATDYLHDKLKLRRATIMLSSMSIVLLLVVRLHLITPLVALPKDPTYQFRKWKTVSKHIQQLAGNDKIVANTYQDASQLWFNTGQFVPTFNIWGRDNQFDFWKDDTAFNGANIYWLHNWAPWEFDNIPLGNNDTIRGKHIQNFALYKYILVEPLQRELKAKRNTLVEIPVTVTNTGPDITISDGATLSYRLMKDYEWAVFDGVRSSFPDSIIKRGSLHHGVNVQMPNEAGIYWIEFSVHSPETLDWKNSEQFTVILE